MQKGLMDEKAAHDEMAMQKDEIIDDLRKRLQETQSTKSTILKDMNKRDTHTIDIIQKLEKSLKTQENRNE